VVSLRDLDERSRSAHELVHVLARLGWYDDAPLAAQEGDASGPPYVGGGEANMAFDVQAGFQSCGKVMCDPRCMCLSENLCWCGPMVSRTEEAGADSM
jgi:hypothetical protein